MATVVSMGSRGLARNLSIKLIPLVLCAVTLAGCYGPFNLTRRVHHWNGHFHENKWPHQGMFLLMIPVYGFSFVIDTFIMNSIEFWLDVNPILPPEDVDGITKAFTNGEKRVVFKRETRAGAPAVVVRLYQADRLVGEFVLARKPDGSTVVRDAAGDVVAADLHANLVEAKEARMRLVATDGVSKLVRKSLKDVPASPDNIDSGPAAAGRGID